MTRSSRGDGRGVGLRPDLRAITGGQGDYTMELARYEGSSSHLAQKVISGRGQAEEGRQGLQLVGR